MALPKDSGLLPRAKALRKEMTPEERKLWYCCLRTYPVKFYRQRIIEHYIVDFYCASAMLVIEVDGTQHYEKSGAGKDRKRDQDLQKLGLTVLRFSNRDVNREFRAVCEAIDREIRGRLPDEP